MTAIGLVAKVVDPEAYVRAAQESALWLPGREQVVHGVARSRGRECTTDLLLRAGELTAVAEGESCGTQQIGGSHGEFVGRNGIEGLSGRFVDALHRCG